MKTNMTRSDILGQALKECMREMYSKAQPPADYDKYVKQVQSGEITDERPYIYQRHYLSDKEAHYIVDKYIDTYRFKNEWISNIDLLLKDLKNGCIVDKYIDDYTDSNGNTHPGYRGYDNRAPLKERISDILKQSGTAENGLSEKICEEVFDYIENRRNFYRFDREENQFNYSIFLGSCPTSNKQAVIDYWKSQGKDIEIVDRDERSFWMRDNGYTEEEIEEELNEIDNEEKS